MLRMCIQDQILFVNNKFWRVCIPTNNSSTILRSITTCISMNEEASGLMTNGSKYRNVTKLRGSFIDENNIFKSLIPDIPESKMYLHEYVWENIDKWSEKTALVCSSTGRSYKYGQLRKLCGRLATSLRKNGLQSGDTIAIIAPNIPEYVIVVMGASEAGLKLTLINPIYTADEIELQLINSEAKAVITVPDNYSIVAKSIVKNTAIRLPMIVIEDGSTVMPSSGVINFKDFISDDIGEFEKSGFITGCDIEHGTLLLPYSSGTTGLPKGVELTHKNQVMNLLQISVKELSEIEPASGNYQEILPLFLPLYHIYGLSVCTFSHLRQGGKLICMPKFTSNGLLEVMERHRITFFYGATPIFLLMANDKRFHKGHMESVKLAMSGAAPITDEVLSNFLSRMGTDLTFCQGYGLTETSPVVSKSKGAPINSVGYQVPNSNIRIVGCDNMNMGKNLGINEIGEIHVCGPHVMKGYYNNPKANADSFDNKWFKTGDLGSFDNEGYLYIQGRLKEIIKVQGHQVSPIEIENIIQKHENVIDVAVIGVAHERYGEIPKAFIVKKPNAKLVEQDMKDFVAKRLAKYKQLGHVVFIDQIPKSLAGKVLRRELQKMQ